jgi:dynein heavy chain
MKDPNAFVRDHLNTFKGKIDTLEVSPHGFKAIRDILKDPSFNYENIKTKSTAAAGLCDWIINIVGYYDVVVQVEPKKIAVASA